jgi:hypothetical protein
MIRRRNLHAVLANHVNAPPRERPARVDLVLPVRDLESVPRATVRIDVWRTVEKKIKLP